MCDGSYEVLRRFPQNILNAPMLKKDPRYYIDRIVRVQADVEQISDVFFKKKFDIVFQRYAIHHMRNPFETAKQLAMLVRPGGVLVFNFFPSGSTSSIMREFRKFFLKKSVNDVHAFLLLVGIVNPSFKEYDIIDVLNDKVTLEPRYKEIVEFLQNAVRMYSVDEVVSSLHYEDFQTPYLHNIDGMSFYRFLVDGLGVEVYEAWDVYPHDTPVGGLAFLAMQVPGAGIKENVYVPNPSDFSDEDIALGDAKRGFIDA